MNTQSTIRNAVTLLLVFMTMVTFASLASAVEFETIRANMKGMTSVAWDDYTKSLKGQSISWTGWISDVKEQWLGGFKVLIDMDPPGSASVQDVYIEDLHKSVAAQFRKNQKVRFSGKIKSVMNVLGSCAVTLENASIRLAESEVMPLTDQQKASYLSQLNLPQIVAMRKAIDAYLTGKISPFLEARAIPVGDSGFKSGLEAFPKKYYQGKFVLLYEVNHLGGGVTDHIISQNNPQLVFAVWMYKTDDNWVLRDIAESILSRNDRKNLELIKGFYSPMLKDPVYGF